MVGTKPVDQSLVEAFAAEGKLVPPDMVVQMGPYIEPPKEPTAALGVGRVVHQRNTAFVDGKCVFTESTGFKVGAHNKL